MIDTRCYNCIENYEPLDIEEIHTKPIFTNKEYKGKGKFVCPKCGDILDLSENTYTIVISRKYDEDSELYTEFLELDPKLKEDGKDIFKQDMIECDIFDDTPLGKYKLEVLWYYYHCGGMYESLDDWGIKIEILSKEEINYDERNHNLKYHLRRWKDYMSIKTVCKRILSVEGDKQGKTPEIEVDRYKY